MRPWNGLDTQCGAWILRPRYNHESSSWPQAISNSRLIYIPSNKIIKNAAIYFIAEFLLMAGRREFSWA